MNESRKDESAEMDDVLEDFLYAGRSQEDDVTIAYDSMRSSWEKSKTFFSEETVKEAGLRWSSFMSSNRSRIQMHDVANRPLEAKCAFAQLVSSPPSTFFQERRKVYGTCQVGTGQMRIYSVEHFKVFLQMLYLSDSNRDFSKEKRVFGRSRELILENIKGTKFREYLGEYIHKKFSRVMEELAGKDPEQICLNDAIEFLLRSSEGNFERNYILMCLGDSRKEIVKYFYQGAKSEEFSDFMHALLTPLGTRNLGFAGYYGGVEDISYLVRAEERRIEHNLVNNETTASCTMGPTGYNYHVAVQQAMDPEMGLVFVDRREFLSSLEKHVGVAYIVRCVQDGEMVWLVDGCDFGCDALHIEKYLIDALYDGIRSAAEDAPEMPSRILFNMHVKNRNAKKAASRIKTKGSRKEVQLTKIGGVEVLEECEQFLPLFWEQHLEQLNDDLNQNKYTNFSLLKKHYIEAHHYRTGSIWYPGGSFVADVVEVSL